LNGCASGEAASPVATGVKAKVTLLDPGEALTLAGCHADVTPGVSPGAAGDQAGCLLLLPAADACGDMPLCWPAAGVKGGGDGSDESVCLAVAPAIVLFSGRSAKGWLCGE
jgi:hypothetical protein